MRTSLPAATIALYASGKGTTTFTGRIIDVEQNDDGTATVIIQDNGTGIEITMGAKAQAHIGIMTTDKGSTQQWTVCFKLVGGERKVKKSKRL